MPSSTPCVNRELYCVNYIRETDSLRKQTKLYNRETVFYKWRALGDIDG